MFFTNKKTTEDSEESLFVVHMFVSQAGVVLPLAGATVESFGEWDLGVHHGILESTMGAWSPPKGFWLKMEL